MMGEAIRAYQIELTEEDRRGLTIGRDIVWPSPQEERMNIPPMGIGGILAIVVLIVTIVLAAIGHLPLLLAGLIGALALARLC